MVRVLIVDDEKPICDLIDLNLSAAGYRCSAVQDGMEAIRRIETEPFDLILLDVMLPGADGYDIMEYIRPLGIPVIFITARHEVRDRVRGLRLGADDYLVKPFEIVELLARVENVLRLSGRGQALLKAGDVTVDVAMLQVTPMDSHGNFNFGLNTSHLADMLERAKIVIVEVNRNMPWVNGLNGSEINIRDVDFVVEGDNPPVAQLGGGGEQRSAQGQQHCPQAEDHQHRSAPAAPPGGLPAHGAASSGATGCSSAGGTSGSSSPDA